MCTELVGIAAIFGRVMTASEAAQELRALHGPKNDTSERVLARSLAVVRPVVEAVRDDRRPLSGDPR